MIIRHPWPGGPWYTMYVGCLGCLSKLHLGRYAPSTLGVVDPPALGHLCCGCNDPQRRFWGQVEHEVWTSLGVNAALDAMQQKLSGPESGRGWGATVGAAG